MSRNDNGAAVLDSQIGEKMENTKICLPVNDRKINNQGCVKLDTDVLAIISNYSIKTGWSNKKVASMIIRQAEANGLIAIGGEE
nr:MAG TPA: hypothetical protein [Caudoviricetes sp.]